MYWYTAERNVNVCTSPNSTADHIHINGMAVGRQVRFFTSDGRLILVGISSDIDLISLLQVGKEVIKVVINNY